MSDELDLIGVHNAGDYGSEFESDSDVDRARSQREDLAKKPRPEKQKLASKREVTEEYNKEEGRKMRFHVLSMDAYARHKKFINDYLMYFGGSPSDLKRDASRDKTDIDVIHENHRFLWTDADESAETWEKRMAKKYHDKLYKEYCITDLSRYRENKIAMRWRIEKEVVVGKGQFECGNKHCDSRDGLRTWEVNFGYVEHGEKKNALVKLRLCPECSYKLNYHKRRKEVTKKKRDHEVEESTTKRHKTDSCESGKKEKKIREHEGDRSQAEASASSTSRSRKDDDYFEDMFL